MHKARGCWSSSNIEVNAACLWYGDREGLGGGDVMVHAGGHRDCPGKYSPQQFGLWTRGPLAVLRHGFVYSELHKNLVDYVNSFHHGL